MAGDDVPTIESQPGKLSVTGRPFATSLRMGTRGVFDQAQRLHEQAIQRGNPHYHTVFLDGVFAPEEEGKLEFHPLGSLSNSELADLMQAVRIRMLGYLERQGTPRPALQSSRLCRWTLPWRYSSHCS